MTREQAMVKAKQIIIQYHSPDAIDHIADAILRAYERGKHDGAAEYDRYWQDGAPHWHARREAK